VPLILSYTLR